MPWNFAFLKQDPTRKISLFQIFLCLVNVPWDELYKNPALALAEFLCRNPLTISDGIDIVTGDIAGEQPC